MGLDAADSLHAAVSAICWNPTLICLQDFDFLLQVALTGREFFYQSGVTGYYRMREWKITKMFTIKYAVCRYAILDGTISLLANQGELGSIRR